MKTERKGIEALSKVVQKEIPGKLKINANINELLKE